MGQDLVRHAKDALNYLYDPVRLQTHPLLDLLTVPRKAGETWSEALRRVLWEAIEALRPADNVPQNRPEWLNYRLLWLHYVQSQTMPAICRELGLAERSFYRRQGEAIEAVASILCTRYERKEATQANPSPADRVREQAVRLACQFHCRPVELPPLVRDVQDTLQSLLSHLGVTLEINAPPNLPPAYGDPTAFRQILLSVLTDALKLVTGACLRVEVSLGREEMVWRIPSLNGAGVSVPELEQETGYVVSQGLLAACGGTLWFERDVQRQLAVCFSLPVARHRIIVAIDDDEETVALYQRYLLPHGYVVQEEHNLDWVQANSPSLPDLILLDVLMPREDGWKIMQRLKANPATATIPIVICSVLKQPRLALALGAAEVLQKPIDQALLLETLERLTSLTDNPHGAPPTELAST